MGGKHPQRTDPSYIWGEALIIVAAATTLRRCLARSGGRERLGSISKQCDRYLRSLFVAGAPPLCQDARYRASAWLTALLARRPTKVAAIALANKRARMAWAVMTTGPRYNCPASLKV